VTAQAEPTVSTFHWSRCGLQSTHAELVAPAHDPDGAIDKDIGDAMAIWNAPR